MERIRNFFFKNTTTKQTVAKNSFWLFASEMAARLLKMGLVVYAARTLGVDGWGTFSYAISMSSLLMIFSDFGIGDLVMREVTQKKEGYKTFVSTALLLKILLLVISTLLVILVSPSISHIPQARALFPIVALILFFDSMRELGLSINRASEKMERDMIVKTVTNALIFGLGILFLVMRRSPESMALAYAIGSAVGFAVVAVIIRKDIRTFITAVDTTLFKKILLITWPFAFLTLIGILLGNIDIYMLGIWRSASEIGLYASVQRVQQFLIIVPTTLATAVFPLMSRLAHTDAKQFKIIFEKTCTLIMIAALPLSLGGIVLSDQLVPLVFGQGYLGAIPMLQILMMLLLVSSPLVLLSNGIFAYNKQVKLASAYLFGIFANVVLNSLLIPSFGAIGSAIATLVSTTIITALIWKRLQRINYFEVLSKLKKSFLATLGMLCVVLILKYAGVHILENILISSASYFGLLLLLKEPLFKELKEILNQKIS